MATPPRLNRAALDAVQRAGRPPARVGRLNVDLLQCAGRPPARVGRLNVDLLQCAGRPPARIDSVTLDLVIQVVPGVPVDLQQTSSSGMDVTVEWSASGAGLPPTGYEWRLDGGPVTAVGASPTVLTVTLTAPAQVLELRAVAGGARSEWASVAVASATVVELAAVRRRRVSTITLERQAMELTMSAVRRRRVSTIGFLQDVRVMMSAVRQRRVPSLLLERSAADLRITLDRRRRVSSVQLGIPERTVLFAAARRRRVPVVTLQRPAADLRFTATRRRRVSTVGVGVPDGYVSVRAVRRRRVWSSPVLEVSPGTTGPDGTGVTMQMLPDGSWTAFVLVAAHRAPTP